MNEESTKLPEIPKDELTFPLHYTLEELTYALRVAKGLLETYEKGQVNGGSIDWEDLDALCELARQGLPRLAVHYPSTDSMESEDSAG